MANYNNARDSQMFGGYDGSTIYTMPLPPCKNAYSVGPSASDDSVLTAAWLSAGYNLSTSVPFSECGLIKDSDDVFYYAAWYDFVGIHVFVQTYDAENDVSTDYEITVPAELSNMQLDNSQIFMRKKSSTQLDLVFFGFADGDSTTFIIQHYLWTIGAATMTLIEEQQYSEIDGKAVSNIVARALQGSLVINVHFNSLINMLSMSTYDLDTQAFDTQIL